MKLRFYIDPQTDQPHIWNHAVTELEVAQVLANADEDRPGADDSRIAMGRTAAGRCLRVVYVPDETPGSVFVVTAYNVAGKSLRAFRRRRRRKP